MNAIFPLAILLSSLLSPTIAVQAQQYDLLIKGGHVIDPKNGIDRVLDVAVADGKIARVAADISPSQASRVADVRGFYVTPGLIDIHAHVFYGTEPDASYSSGYRSVSPDGFTFRAGVTTVVDAGGAGWRNFHQFKKQVIDQVQTRVLALVNIVGSGMKGGPVEQNLSDMDARLTAMRARQFPDLIVGVKTAHYRGPEWDPVERAVEAGHLADLPVMVDFGSAPGSGDPNVRFVPGRPFEDLVTKRLRPGDIYTHTYLGAVPMLDGEGTARTYLFEAQKRGVIFDVGHGGGSFKFWQAAPAVRQGFLPNTISTDLHARSMNGGMKDMANVMSKFLNLGMSLQDVILRSTWNPAQAIRRTDLGHLDEGAVADIAVFNLRQGDFGFMDVAGGRLKGTQKLECELTLREGRVVWDLNALAGTDWEQMPRQ